MKGFPEVGKGGLGHVGVSDDAVGLADQLVDGVSAEISEGLVCLGNAALEVGLGVDEGIFGDKGFNTGAEGIGAHRVSGPILMAAEAAGTPEEVKKAPRRPGNDSISAQQEIGVRDLYRQVGRER